MKLAGYEKRLEAHKRRIAATDMDHLYKREKKRWGKLLQRLGYLEARVERLRAEAKGKS